MNILYVTSEAVPFCKTGGLADVAGSLPQSLAANGDRVSVILPLYQSVADAWRDRLHFERYTYVRLAWRSLYCGLFALQCTLHTVYSDDHAGDVHISSTFQLRIYLSHCLAGSHNVLDDNDLFAVCQLLAHKHATLAVVFDLLAVEAEVDIFLVLVRQSHCRSCCQRNALIGRTEHGFHRNVVLGNAGCIIASQFHQLGTAVIVAGVDEIRCFSAAFQGEFPERQHAAVYHKTQE